MIDQYSLIPPKAFLYFPSYEMTVQYSNKQKLRTIFSGNIDFDENEKQKIEAIKQKIKSNPKNKYMEDYSDDFLLRSFQAAQFKIEDTIKSLKEYHVWQKKTLPLIISNKTEELLKNGILYICGRDCYYRPIIVVNAKKILDLKIDNKDLTECLSFFFEFTIQNILIEGQIEQWIIIIDLGNASIFSLGKSMLDIIVHLSAIFKVRAVQNYLINCPGSIKVLWSALKNVLNQDQIRKISMSEKKQLKPVDFSRINRSQVQQKYGGTYPNIKQYWPLHMNLNQVSVETIDITSQVITQSQYDSMFNQNKLKNRKIKKGFITKYKQLRIKQNLECERMTQRDQNEDNDTWDLTEDNIMDIEYKMPAECSPGQICSICLAPLQFEELF